DRHGLAGHVTPVVLHQDRVDVGPTAGLFVSHPPAAPPAQLYRRVAGARPIIGLNIIDGAVTFCGAGWSDSGSSGQTRVIFPEVSNGLFRASRHPDVVYASNYDGVHWARRVDGEWQIGGRVPGVTSEVYDFAEAADGSIWGGLGHAAVVRIQPAADGGT